MKKFVQFMKDFGAPVLALALPVVVTAAGNNPSATAPLAYSDASSLAGSSTSILCVAINWMFYILIILTIIFVLWAAFKYLTAAGDPEKVKSAGTILLYAAVAVVVAILAKGFPFIIGSIFGGGFSAGNFC